MTRRPALVRWTVVVMIAGAALGWCFPDRHAAGAPAWRPTAVGRAFSGRALASHAERGPARAREAEP